MFPCLCIWTQQERAEICAAFPLLNWCPSFAAHNCLTNMVTLSKELMSSEAYVFCWIRFGEPVSDFHSYIQCKAITLQVDACCEYGMEIYFTVTAEMKPFNCLIPCTENFPFSQCLSLLAQNGTSLFWMCVTDSLNMTDFCRLPSLAQTPPGRMLNESFVRPYLFVHAVQVLLAESV